MLNRACIWQWSVLWLNNLSRTRSISKSRHNVLSGFSPFTLPILQPSTPALIKIPFTVWFYVDNLTPLMFHIPLHHVTLPSLGRTRAFMDLAGDCFMRIFSCPISLIDSNRVSPFPDIDRLTIWPFFIFPCTNAGISYYLAIVMTKTSPADPTNVLLTVESTSSQRNFPLDTQGMFRCQ